MFKIYTCYLNTYEADSLESVLSELRNLNESLNSSFELEWTNQKGGIVTAIAQYKDKTYILEVTDGKKTNTYKSTNRDELLSQLSGTIKDIQIDQVDINSSASFEVDESDEDFSETESDGDEDDGDEDDELSDELENQNYQQQIQQVTTIGLEQFEKQYKNLEPRDYQVSVLEKSLENLKKNHKGIAVLPTGFGKTFICSNLASELKKFSKKETFRVLFLVHKNDIVLQTAKLFDDKGNKGAFASYFGADNIGVFIGLKGLQYKAKNNIFTGKENEVIIANFNTFSNVLKNFPSDYFDLIIADECHRSIGRTYKRCIEHFKPTYLLGVTATPSRTSKAVGLTTSDLMSFYNGNILCEVSLEDAITEHILATPHYCIRFDPDLYEELITEIKVQIALNQKGGVLKNIKSYTSVWHMFDQDLSKLNQEKKKTVIFCESIDIAEQVYSRCITQVSSQQVHKMFARREKIDNSGRVTHKAAGHVGKITPQIYNDIVNKFKSSTESQFIIVVDLFTEGTDIPEIQALMMLRPTTSERIYFQILGRGLRKSEGKDSCQVYDYNFDTVSYVLLKKKLNLFNTIRPYISNTEGFAEMSEYVDKISEEIKMFESDSSQIDSFKREYLHTFFKTTVLAEHAKKIYTIIQKNKSSTQIVMDALEQETYVWSKRSIKLFCSLDIGYVKQLIMCTSEQQVYERLCNTLVNHASYNLHGIIISDEVVLDEDITEQQRELIKSIEKEKELIPGSSIIVKKHGLLYIASSTKKGVSGFKGSKTGGVTNYIPVR